MCWHALPFFQARDMHAGKLAEGLICSSQLLAMNDLFSFFHCLSPICTQPHHTLAHTHTHCSLAVTAVANPSWSRRNQRWWERLKISRMTWRRGPIKKHNYRAKLSYCSSLSLCIQTGEHRWVKRVWNIKKNKEKNVYIMAVFASLQGAVDFSVGSGRS